MGSRGAVWAQAEGGAEEWGGNKVWVMLDAELRPSPARPPVNPFLPHYLPRLPPAGPRMPVASWVQGPCPGFWDAPVALGRDLDHHRGAELLAGSSSRLLCPGPAVGFPVPRPRSTDVGGTLPSVRPSTPWKTRAGGGPQGSGVWNPAPAWEGGSGGHSCWEGSPQRKSGDRPPQ